MVKLHILNAQGTLTPYISRIEMIFENTKNTIEEQIPIDNIDIVAVDNKNGIIPEISIGGHTHGPNFIVLSFDSKSEDFEDNLQKNFPDQIAHEFHHAARWQQIGYGKTLLEALITEGLACKFALEISGKQQPWTNALRENEIEKFLEKSREQFDNPNYKHYAWFYGSDDIPRWTGYSLGFYLVERYLKSHPNETAASLYKTKAQEFTSDL